MSDKYFKLMEESKLFKSLPKDEIKSYLENGKFIVKNYKKGSVIHFEDEVCDKIEMILSGKVVIDSLDEAGNLLNITDFYKDGILGGNLIFSSHPYYPMTITALSDSTIVSFNKNTLTELFDASKSLLMTFMELISDNTSILSRKIKTNINKSIREKITIYLRTQQKLQGTSNIKLNIPKNKLAEKMGVQRTSLSRELAKMKAEGFIDYDRDKMSIIKLP